MDSDLEPFWRSALQQRFKLRGVQVVGGGEAFQAEFIFEVFGAEAVGDVEGEIANTPVGGEKGEMLVVANEVTVGLTRADLLEGPFFASFEDARRSDENCGVRSAEC